MVKIKEVDLVFSVLDMPTAFALVPAPFLIDFVVRALFFPTSRAPFVTCSFDFTYCFRVSLVRELH